MEVRRPSLCSSRQSSSVYHPACPPCAEPLDTVYMAGSITSLRILLVANVTIAGSVHYLTCPVSSAKFVRAQEMLAGQLFTLADFNGTS